MRSEVFTLSLSASPFQLSIQKYQGVHALAQGLSFQLHVQSSQVGSCSQKITLSPSACQFQLSIQMHPKVLPLSLNACRFEMHGQSSQMSSCSLMMDLYLFHTSIEMLSLDTSSFKCVATLARCALAQRPSIQMSHQNIQIRSHSKLINLDNLFVQEKHANNFIAFHI